MKLVVNALHSEELSAKWLADAIKATFPALVNEIEVVVQPKPPEPLALDISDLSGIASPIGDVFVSITSAFEGITQSLADAFSGINFDELNQTIAAMTTARQQLEAANGNGPKAIETGPQPAEVHAGISGDLVPHSTVFARTDQGREYLAAATFNPVLPHANQPIRLSITAD